MKKVFIILLFQNFICSCEKDTSCMGHITDKNSNPLPNKNIYLTDSKRSGSKVSIVAVTDADGYYAFSTKTKKSHSYYVTFGTENYWYFTLPYGGAKRVDVVLPN